MTESSSGHRGGDSGGWTIGDLDVVRKPVEAADPLAMWTKLGLACLFLAVATPLVGLSGLLTTALLAQLAASGLELSHAKLPAFSLPTDWDLRLAYVLALAVMSVRAGVSRLPRPTWKVAGLGPWRWWLLLGGGLWLACGASLVFELRMFDIADGVHLVVLGSTWMWSTATTMWLIASVGRAGVVLLAVAAQRSRIVGGSVATVGIASMVIAAPVLGNTEQIDRDDVRRGAPFVGAVLDEIDEAVGALRRLSAEGSGTTPALPPTGGGGSVADDRYTTAQCMEELAKKPPNKLQSPVEEVIGNIARRVRDRDLAREIVHTKMIKICTKNPKRQEGLVKLLQRAATFGATDTQRDATRVRLATLHTPDYDDIRDRCISFIDGRSEEETSFEDLQHERSTIEMARKELSPDDQRLIQERYFDGLEYEEMAPDWKLSKPTISRRTSRAVERLREQIARLCL